MPNDKPTPQSDGCIEKIHERAMEAASMDELAVVLRDAGEAILWLHTCVLIATRNSLYAKQMKALRYPEQFHLEPRLRTDAINVHMHAQGDASEPVLASDGSTAQLNAALGALQALFGTQWSIRAASEILRPGVEYDAPRSAVGEVAE